MGDDVSTTIAKKLYLVINRVEQLLRRYLTKFFIQRLGIGWWELTASKTMIEKMKIRRLDRNDRISTLVDTDINLIDFDDLGELVYKLSSGFNATDKIVSKIRSIYTLDELNQFKADLKGNYTKYFKRYFKDHEFESQWRELYKIRNKVAHQGVFYKTELERGLSLSNSIVKMIETAEKDMDGLQADYSETIREQDFNDTETSGTTLRQTAGVKVVGKIDLGDYSYHYTGHHAIIDEEELLNELADCEDSRNSGYVGLKWFVATHLAVKGFSIGSTYGIINTLADQGRLELYDIHTEGYPIKAIRTKNAYPRRSTFR